MKNRWRPWVEVYRNLTKNCLSVRCEGRVIAHVNHIWLEDCKFVVREKGRQKVLETKQKNVHAFIKGYWMREWEDKVPPGTGRGSLVTYDPYTHETFRLEVNDQPIHEAPLVEIDGKVMTAWRMMEY